MATANLFHREVSANKAPRNAFNMAYSTLFSSPAGMLLPCYVQEVKAGDKLKLGVNSLTRTSPLVTPAFMAFDEKVDFWAVPIRLIWSDYDNWKAAQTYRHRTTNLAGVGSQNFLPFTTFSSIATFFRGQINVLHMRNGWNQPTAVSALRYLDLLGYSVPNYPGLFVNLDYSSKFQNVNANDFNKDSMVDVLAHHYAGLSKSAPCNYFRLAAFQCIYQHCYRNEEYEVLDPTYYNVDNLFTNLEYDNRIPVAEGTPPKLSTNYELAAYDRGAQIAPVTETTLTNRLTLAKLFTPRYKNWRKDVFTAAKPNNGFFGPTGLQIQNIEESGMSSTYGTGFYWPTFNPNQLRTIGGPDSGNPTEFNPIDTPNTGDSYVFDRNDYTFQTDGDPAFAVQKLYTYVTSNGNDEYGLTMLYPQNIRNLMAQDKYIRAAIYADKNLSSQIKALFGYDKPDPHKPIYLGSYSADVTIDDVTSNSAGEATLNDGKKATAILGELAGKVRQGNGDGSVFSRKFDEDCIVIGVHFVMPRNNYDSYRLNKWNTKVSRFDYYNPYFDGLGNQPVLAYERFVDFDSLLKPNYYPSSLFGFAPRYYEYKQRTNEVHSGFQYDQHDSYWTLSNNFPLASQISADKPEIYKIIPNITDRIFNIEFNGSTTTDPFQHYYYFDATLVSDMEVYGTPSL